MADNVGVTDLEGVTDFEEVSDLEGVADIVGVTEGVLVFVIVTEEVLEIVFDGVPVTVPVGVIVSVDVEDGDKE